MKSYSILLMVVLLALACQPEEFYPISDEDQPRPENWNVEPDRQRPAGFFLEQPDGSTALLFVDRETDHTVVISADPFASCEIAPGPAVAVPFSNDQLQFPVERRQLSTSPTHHLYVMVYDEAYAPGESWCEFSKVMSSIASGIIAFEHVSSKLDCDNEACAHRTHTYYFSATGTLAAEDGAPVRLAVQYRNARSADSFEEAATHTEETIQVRLE